MDGLHLVSPSILEWMLITKEAKPQVDSKEVTVSGNVKTDAKILPPQKVDQ